MASDLNKVILVGRLVRDPEIRYTQGGTSVANFSLASNRTYLQNGEKKELTSFFNCIAWSKLGEIIVQYCKKGRRVGIEGRLQQRAWEDKDGNKRSTVEVVVDNFQFLDGKRDEDEYGKPADYGTNKPAADLNYQEKFEDNSSGSNLEAGDNPFSDEEIPF